MAAEPERGGGKARAEDPTWMEIQTPRGTRWHVSQRDGATVIGDPSAGYASGGKSPMKFSNAALANPRGPVNSETQFRMENRDAEPPAGGFPMTACVEARAAALVSITGGIGTPTGHPDLRRENTRVSPVKRGEGLIIPTCPSCRLAIKHGADVAADVHAQAHHEAARAALAAPDAFPPLGGTASKKK